MFLKKLLYSTCKVTYCDINKYNEFILLRVNDYVHNIGICN